MFNYSIQLRRYDTRCYFNVRSKADMSQIDPQQTSSSAISKFSTLTRSEDKHCLLSVLTSFYPRDAVLARVLAMALCLYVCLSVCVCLSQVCVLSKRLNKSGWFLAWELLCYKEIQVRSKIRVLHTRTLFQTLDLEKISPQHIGRRRVLST